MQHLDDAHGCAESFLSEWIKKKPGRWHILVVKDVLAMIRIVLWCPRKEWASSSDEIDHGLRNTSAEFWSGRVIQGQDRSHPDGAWQDAAWQQAALHESTKKLRILGRHLTKSGWFEAPAEPPWKLRTEHEPAIVLFYSFKGGVGRSTALAATASRLASNGDRVVVLDADLDAPGVASMLAGHGGATAPWGRYRASLRRPVGTDTPRARATLDSDRCRSRIRRNARIPDRRSLPPVRPSGDSCGRQLARVGPDARTARWKSHPRRQAAGRVPARRVHGTAVR